MGSLCVLWRVFIQQWMVREFVEQRILAGQLFQQRCGMVRARIEQLQRVRTGGLLCSHGEQQLQRFRVWLCACFQQQRLWLLARQLFQQWLLAREQLIQRLVLITK